MALDLGSPHCNLELSAVVAGIAGQPMLWEVVHPRAEVLSLSGLSSASRCLMLQGFAHVELFGRDPSSAETVLAGGVDAIAM